MLLFSSGVNFDENTFNLRPLPVQPFCLMSHFNCPFSSFSCVSLTSDWCK